MKAEIAMLLVVAGCQSGEQSWNERCRAARTRTAESPAEEILKLMEKASISADEAVCVLGSVPQGSTQDVGVKAAFLKVFRDHPQPAVADRAQLFFTNNCKRDDPECQAFLVGAETAWYQDPPRKLPGEVAQDLGLYVRVGPLGYGKLYDASTGLMVPGIELELRLFEHTGVNHGTRDFKEARRLRKERLEQFSGAGQK